MEKPISSRFGGRLRILVVLFLLFNYQFYSKAQVSDSFPIVDTWGVDVLGSLARTTVFLLDGNNDIGTTFFRIYPHRRVENRRVRWMLDGGIKYRTQRTEGILPGTYAFDSKLTGFRISISKGREYTLRRKPGKEMMLVFDFPIGYRQQQYHFHYDGELRRRETEKGVSFGVAPAVGFAVHKNPSRPYLRLEVGVNAGAELNHGKTFQRYPVVLESSNNGFSFIAGFRLKILLLLPNKASH